MGLQKLSIIKKKIASFLAMLVPILPNSVSKRGGYFGGKLWPAS